MTAAENPADPVGPAAPIKRRRWYVAAFLSLVCEGLGQLYNGQSRWAAFLFALALGLSGAAMVLANAMTSSIRAFAFYISVAAIGFFVKLCAAAAAGISAWSIGAVEPKRYNRAWVYVALMIAAVGLEFGLPRYVRPWHVYNIPSDSNAPSLIVGDHLMSEKEYFRHNEPQRGEMALFKLPNDSRTDYIKRVVGLPGDSIQMIAGRLHINGVAAQREPIADHIERRAPPGLRIRQYVETLPGGRRYRIREERGDDGPLDNTPPYTVPDGHYFVLGDNRDNSQDSRVLSEVGFVPRANFRDRPTYIIWNPELGRVGLPVE